MGSCLLELPHINGKLSPHPDKLRGISSELPDTAVVCLEGIDGIGPQFVYSVHISYEHIRVLVIFGGDILPYSSRQRYWVCPSKGEEENVTVNIY